MNKIDRFWVLTYTCVFVKIPGHGDWGPETIESRVYTDVQCVDSWDAFLQVVNLSEHHRKVVGNALANNACNGTSGYGMDAQRPPDRMASQWGVTVRFTEPTVSPGDNDFPEGYMPDSVDLPRLGPHLPRELQNV